jgi:hypothetical protein
VSYDHRPSCAFLFCLWCHVVVHHVCCSFEYVINNGWVGGHWYVTLMYVCVCASYVNVVFQLLWWCCWSTPSMSILESLSTERDTETETETECVCVYVWLRP